MSRSFPAADVVIGGPPCQGFSPFGRDRDGASRAALNSLWRHFVRALEQTEPYVFVMENVPELLKSAEFQCFKRAGRPRRLRLRDSGRSAARGRLRRASDAPACDRDRIPSRRSALAPADAHARDICHGSRGACRAALGTRWQLVASRGPNIRPSSIERYKAVPAGGNRFDLARNRPDLCLAVGARNRPVRRMSSGGCGGIGPGPRSAPSSTSRRRGGICTLSRTDRSRSGRRPASRASHVLPQGTTRVSSFPRNSR